MGKHSHGKPTDRGPSVSHRRPSPSSMCDGYPPRLAVTAVGMLILMLPLAGVTIWPDRNNSTGSSTPVLPAPEPDLHEDLPQSTPTRLGTRGPPRRSGGGLGEVEPPDRMHVRSASPMRTLRPAVPHPTTTSRAPGVDHPPLIGPSMSAHPSVTSQSTSVAAPTHGPKCRYERTPLPRPRYIRKAGEHVDLPGRAAQSD